MNDNHYYSNMKKHRSYNRKYYKKKHYHYKKQEEYNENSKTELVIDIVAQIVVPIVIQGGIHLIKYWYRKAINKLNLGKEKMPNQSHQSSNSTGGMQEVFEQEDPKLKLEKKDKEVRSYVFDKLGLDQMNPPDGENVCASKRYSRPLLVGKLVSKGDICVLVSEPGVGKSVLAFQMADDIAEGRESKLFHAPEGHQPPQPVYYWDAEMDSDDMRERYPEGLSDNLVRFSHCNYRDGYHLLKHIYDTVSPLSTDATIVLDNWKALCARIDAYYFFTGLRNLQAQFVQRNTRLTVIIVIHTTKEAIKKYEVDLGDVAGAAQITQAAKNVLFVNPTSFEEYVELHDAKHRPSKKKKDSIVVISGGVGTDENLHFEALENVMEEEKVQKLMKDLIDGSDSPKEPGRPQKITNAIAKAIAKRLDNGESVEDLAEEFSVCESTIRSRSKPYRQH